MEDKRSEQAIEVECPNTFHLTKIVGALDLKRLRVLANFIKLVM